MAINRKLKKEIGVDLQSLFKTTPGTAVIFKVKNNSGRYVSLTSCKNFRFQIGLNGTIPTKDNVTQIDTAHGHYATQVASTYSVQLMFGMEKVLFYGKFNFYYGIDFGPYYSYSNSGYTIYSYINSTNNNYYYSLNNGLPFQSESKKAGFVIAPFVGAKYRISEHFSASIESSFYLSYFITATKLTNLPYYTSISNSNNTTAAKTNTNGFDFSMKYLRFLTLNYHF